MSSSLSAPSPERAAELREALNAVRQRVKEATIAGQSEPRLVAVSKLKPAEDIMACYENGQRDFGENYAGELAEKAAVLPNDIRWHFIGGLQSNKCKPLAVIPNIWAVQTVDSEKKAHALNKNLPEERSELLNVYIQVNTSGEDQKSGIGSLSPASGDSPSELVTLAKTIIGDCPRLRLLGLMTIGSFEASTDQSHENPDFKRLMETRNALEAILKSDPNLGGWGNDGHLELSMGMSSDFVDAIKAGSSSVRVGTSIFGSRPPRIV